MSSSLDARLVRLRKGLALVALGLLVQLLTWLWWAPGTFVVFALVGIPLVLLGVIVVALSLRKRPETKVGS